MSKWVVAALYKFVPLPDAHEWRAPLRQVCEANGLVGTLLLAPEGINGTVAGTREGLDELLRVLLRDTRFSGLEYKESYALRKPFGRMKVRMKKEIVTLGVPGIDPNRAVGEYVDAHDWNALIADPNTVVVDTRNAYETDVGMFEGALDPRTSSFRQFPEFVTRELDPSKHKRIAMYCTGGIRCEKATAFMLERGFKDVFHLRGGILRYLEQVPRSEGLWRGDCFVFDERVAVGYGLTPSASGISSPQ